jgi:hypothetical protein
VIYFFSFVIRKTPNVMTGAANIRASRKMLQADILRDPDC